MKEEFAYPGERFKGFSDAVFAIAITLLVLKFALPSTLPDKPTLAEQLNALLSMCPQNLYPRRNGRAGSSELLPALYPSPQAVSISAARWEGRIVGLGKRRDPRP